MLVIQEQHLSWFEVCRENNKSKSYERWRTNWRSKRHGPPQELLRGGGKFRGVILGGGKDP